MTNTFFNPGNSKTKLTELELDVKPPLPKTLSTTTVAIDAHVTFTAAHTREGLELLCVETWPH